MQVGELRIVFFPQRKWFLALVITRRKLYGARLGGDEFVILLEKIDDRKACVVVAEKISKAMRSPFSLIGKSVGVTLSNGVCVYPDDTTDRDAMLTLSDKAMYKAKMSGKNQIRYDSDSLKDL